MKTNFKMKVLMKVANELSNNEISHKTESFYNMYGDIEHKWFSKEKMYQV